MSANRKLTKPELIEALCVAEAQHEEKDQWIAELEASVADLDRHITVLSEENLTRITNAAQLEDALRQVGAAVAEVQDQVEQEQLATDLVEEALVADITKLFGHLVFVYSGLAAIVSYNGTDVGVLQDLAHTVGACSEDFVQEAQATGRYTDEGARDAAMRTVLVTLDLPEPEQHCCGSCEEH